MPLLLKKLGCFDAVFEQLHSRVNGDVRICYVLIVGAAVIDSLHILTCLTFPPSWSGYSLEALLLELQLLDSTTHVPGETLTGVEKRYRTQWIGALHAVMQNVSARRQLRPGLRLSCLEIVMHLSPEWWQGDLLLLDKPCSFRDVIA